MTILALWLVFGGALFALLVLHGSAALAMKRLIGFIILSSVFVSIVGSVSGFLRPDILASRHSQNSSNVPRK